MSDQGKAKNPTLAPLSPEELATLLMAARRVDGWVNLSTGLGTTSDKAAAAKFRAVRVRSYETFTDLFEGDALFYRIASKVVTEGFRPGYQLTGDNTQKVLESVSHIGASMHPNEPTVEKAIISAQSWANALGGAVIILFFEGETVADLATPRRPGAKLTSLRVKSAQDCYPKDVYLTVPEFYAVVGDETYTVHSSRVIPFFGEEVSLRHRRQLRGWGQSYFVKPFDTIQRWRNSLGSMAALLSDVAQGVFKIDGLFEGAATTNDTRAQKRLAFLDLNRSSGKSIFLDSKDSFERAATPLAGVSDVLRELQSAIALDTDYPITELFGISPAGLNATGEYDAQRFLNRVNTYRVTEVGPRLLQLYRVVAEGMGIQPGSIGLEWNALSEEDSAKEAGTAKTRTEVVVSALNEGLLTMAQARLALAKGGDIYTVLDVAALEADLSKEGAGLDIPDTDEEEPKDLEKDTEDGAPPAQQGRALLTSTDNAEIVLVRHALEREGLPLYTGEMAKYLDWTVAAFREFQRAKTAAEIMAMFPTASPTQPTGVTVEPTKPEAPAKPEAPKAPGPPAKPEPPEVP